MWKVASIHIGKPLKWQICGVWKNVVDCRPWFNLEFWQPVCVEWKQKKKVVCPAIFILRGMGVAWQRWGQRCVSCLCGARGPGPGALRCSSISWWVFYGENYRLRFGKNEVSGQLQLVSTSEKKKSLSTFFSVGLCKVCVSGCVWECVGRFSSVFSQRRFTKYVLSPLATLPCGGGKKRTRAFIPFLVLLLLQCNKNETMSENFVLCSHLTGVSKIRPGGQSWTCVCGLLTDQEINSCKTGFISSVKIFSSSMLFSGYSLKKWQTFISY